MSESSVPVLPCMCASLRRAGRALTQVYEEELRPIGLTATQFTILQVLSLAGKVTQGELARMLAMDSTTLTRTLRTMGGPGWIAKQRGRDRREWRLQLSKAGKVKFRHALPRWERAQKRLQGQLTETQWNELMKLTNHVTNVFTKPGEPSSAAPPVKSI